ncbi:MAG: ABC transporter permease [Candidatus Kapaibacterium sp.]
MQTSRIAVIIRHEVLTRVRTKAFILATLLTPLGFAAITVLPVLVSMWSEDAVQTKVLVSDRSGVVGRDLMLEDSSLFELTTKTEDELRRDVTEERIKGFVVIPATFTETDTVNLYTSGGGGLSLHGRVKESVRAVIRHRRIMDAGATPSVLSAMDMKVAYKAKSLSEEGEGADAAEFKAMVGYILSFIIYMAMFIYGGLVMRAVLEEKTNRIVEVLASSARPFENMLGKILGVACVGLLQMVSWIALSSLITYVAGAQYAAPAAGTMAASGVGPKIIESIGTLSLWVPVAFLFYFLAGYFLYSALFAAVAAAANQEQDVQSLQLPVSLPLMIPFLFIGAVMNDPDGTLATVMSMIPLFTPTIMIIRVMATQVPVWQIVVSSVLLVLTFVGAVWAGGRIYRVGILSYGKKPSYRDMMRWLING